MIAFVVLVVVVVALAAVFFAIKSNDKTPEEQPAEQEAVQKKKPDATAKWNVYRDDDLGFEIKYPDHCKMNDEYLGDSYAFYLEITSTEWEDGAASVNVINHGNVGTSALKDFIGQLRDPVSGQQLSAKETKFNGYDAYEAAGENKVSYFFLNGLDVYEVSKIGGSEPKDQDQILGTFRLIK